MIMNGTGTPKIQPASKIFLRPTLSAKAPERRLETAFTSPKEMMNEKMAVLKTNPNCSEPTSGTTVRSKPTIPPTKAFTRTSSANCRQFSLRPSRTVGEGLLSPASAVKNVRLARRAAVRAGLELRGLDFRFLPGPIEFHDALVVLRRGRGAARDPLDEDLLFLV